MRFTFDLFSRMSTQKPFEVLLQGAFRLATLDSLILATTEAQPQINAKALKLLLRFSDSVFQLNKRTLKNQQWVNNQPKGTIYFKYSQFLLPVSKS